ncbi:hypothetical protein [Parafilimonas sp.]|uniref:hypothetical protein n=1 Tax=Parafilimonas sp. TaxID=1969739 RepID=UPI0039E5DDAC
MNKNFIYLLVVTCFLLFFSCQKEYSYEEGSVLAAEGSLLDSSGDCLPSTIYGTYYNGITPGSDTAYVEIEVNVTQTGSYNIQSDTLNGLSFSDSGYFSSTGINIVQLKPNGTPIIYTTSTYSYSFDSTTCSFSLTVQDSTGTGLGSDSTSADSTVSVGDDSWQFVANGQTFSGSIELAQSVAATSGNQLVIAGVMESGGTDTAFGLTVQFTGTTVDTGSYVTSDTGTIFSFTDATAGNIIYAANTTADPVITIKLLSYDSSTNIVTGTFSGNAYDVDGNTVPITDGQFSATLE